VIYKNGGETRNRTDIYTGDTEGFNAGDTDTVGAEVTESGIKGRKIMDPNLVHITEVSESNRYTNEESAGKHEGLLGGGGTPYQAQSSRCLASNHRVSQWKCSLCSIPQPQCWCWLPGPRFARCFCLSWLVCIYLCIYLFLAIHHVALHSASVKLQ